jgi:hypothetical protein
MSAARRQVATRDAAVAVMLELAAIAVPKLQRLVLRLMI